jgi:hypothetical protein
VEPLLAAHHADHQAVHDEPLDGFVDCLVVGGAVGPAELAEAGLVDAWGGCDGGEDGLVGLLHLAGLGGLVAGL